jgi:hypothetical protein
MGSLIAEHQSILIKFRPPWVSRGPGLGCIIREVGTFNSCTTIPRTRSACRIPGRSGAPGRPSASHLFQACPWSYKAPIDIHRAAFAPSLATAAGPRTSRSAGAVRPPSLLGGVMVYKKYALWGAGFEPDLLYHPNQLLRLAATVGDYHPRGGHGALPWR